MTDEPQVQDAQEYETTKIGGKTYGRAHVTRALQVKLARCRDTITDAADAIVGLEAEQQAAGNAIAALVDVVPFDTAERDRLLAERKRIRQEIRKLSEESITAQAEALGLRLEPAATPKFLLDNLDQGEFSDLADWLDLERPTQAPLNGSS